jgi:ATP-binding cassette subfamily C protein CydC
MMVPGGQCLQEISFSYPEQPQKALNGINLSISAGEHVAVLGALQVAVNQHCSC